MNRLLLISLVFLSFITTTFSQGGGTTFDQFVGTNAFIDDPIDKLAAFGNVREYHIWDFNVPDGYSGNGSDIDYEYNRWSGYWDFDQYYTDLKAAGVEPLACIWKSASFLGQNNGENKPVDSPGDNTTDPNSYQIKAEYMWQYAARYGSTTHPPSDLNVAAGQIVTSGLNLIRYYEDWNEQDKYWEGDAAEFSPQEYAAMASADVDGHGGTMSGNVGIKNADPNSIFVMGGIAASGTTYIAAMKTWFEQNRPQGDWPIDVINMHHYCNHGGDQGGGVWDYGESPEDNNLKGKITTVMNWINANVPGTKLWLSEWGYDVAGVSDNQAIAFGGKDTYTVWSEWVLRTYLVLSSTGMERAQQFMLRDTEAESGGSGRFNTSGFTSSMDTGHQPKKGWYDVQAMRTSLTGLTFTEVIEESGAIYVYKYENQAGDEVGYALWSPTSNGSTTSYNLNVGAATTASMVTPDGTASGASSNLNVSGGTVSVSVSEMPVFVKTSIDNTDSQAPTRPSNLSSSSVTETSLSLSWSSSTDNVGVTGYKIYQNSSLITTVTGTSYNVTGLTAGSTYTFEVAAIDAVGNESTKSSPEIITTIAVDTQAPSTPSNLSSSNVTTNSVSLTWSSSTDNVGVTSYTIYQNFIEIATSVNTSYIVSGLSEATDYTYYVIASDAAGNVSSQSNVLSVTTTTAADTQAPSSPSNLTNTVLTSSAATVTWSASSDNVGVVFYRVKQNGSTVQTVTGLIATLTGLSTGQTYIITVTALDAAGNESTSSNTVQVTPQASADTTDPTQPGLPSSSNVTATTVALLWSPSSDDTGVAGYKIYANGILISTVGNITSTTITGLTPQTSYTITVKAFDAAGNESPASGGANISTLAAADTQAPTTPANLQFFNVAETTASVTWSVATDNVGVTAYKVYKNGTYIQTVSGTSIGLTGLTGGTTYTISVSAVDAAANESGQGLVQLTTTTAVDTTAPTAPSNLISQSQTSTSITLAWTASSDASGIENYSVYKNGVLDQTVVGTAANVIGLSVGTSYLFYVIATDNAGNISMASNTLTASPLDEEDPSIPINVFASAVTTSSASINWSASTDNIGVTGYNVYNNGTLLTSVTTTSYQMTALTEGTAYSITITAVDAASNESSISLPASFTTLVTADVESPTIPTNLIATRLTSVSVMLSWTASTDNVGVIGYEIYKDAVLMETAASNSYVMLGLVSGQTYLITIKAKDAAGNLSYTAAVNYTNSISTGINNQQLAKTVRIYPNPSNGLFNVDSPEEAYIKITSANGSVLSIVKIVAGNTVVDLSDQSAGLYHVMIMTDTASTFKTIIIK